VGYPGFSFLRERESRTKPRKREKREGERDTDKTGEEK